MRKKGRDIFQPITKLGEHECLVAYDVRSKEEGEIIKSIEILNQGTGDKTRTLNTWLAFRKSGNRDGYSFGYFFRYFLSTGAIRILNRII